MTAGFLDELDIRVLDPRTPLVQLLGDFRYRDKKGRVFTCPEGMISDLASVPKVARSFTMPWQLTARPAYLHDGLYRYYEEWEIERGESDGLYHESLLVIDAPHWRTSGQWSVLRGTGWRSWNRWREVRRIEPASPPPPPIEWSVAA